MGLQSTHDGASLDPERNFIRGYNGASLNPYHSITMIVYSIYKDFTKFAMFPFASVKHHCTLVKISRCKLWCSKVFELELGLRHFTSHGAGLQKIRVCTRGFNKSDFWSHLIQIFEISKTLAKIDLWGFKAVPPAVDEQNFKNSFLRFWCYTVSWGTLKCSWPVKSHSRVNFDSLDIFFMISNLYWENHWLAPGSTR